MSEFARNHPKLATAFAAVAGVATVAAAVGTAAGIASLGLSHPSLPVYGVVTSVEMSSVAVIAAGAWVASKLLPREANGNAHSRVSREVGPLNQEPR